MKWFLDLKITSKLIFASLAVSLLAAIVGAVGIGSLLKLKQADTALYERDSLALQYSGETAVSILQLQYYVLQQRYVKTPKETEEVKQLIIDYQKLTDDKILTLADSITQKYKNNYELNSLVTQLNDNWLLYNEALNSYFDYVDQGVLSKSIEVRETMSQLGATMKDGILQFMTIISQVAGDSAKSNGRTAITTIIFMVLVVIVVIVLSILLGMFVAGIIGKPLLLMTRLANMLSVGDIETDWLLTGSDAELDKRKDEIGMLSSAFNKLIESTKKQIKAAQYVSEGDLTANVEIRSNNDVLGKALSALVKSLNRMVIAIVGASEQVSAGANSLSDSSLSLSQGATEQASSVEELTASLEQIGSQTILNAQNADTANKFAKNAKAKADGGNDQMKEMLKAMDEINVSSRSINKIIKVIDDIAFQTNILALNAAVEAARAGQHGLGFAVVAEEVRTLAAKSATAAKETTQLIESSIKKVKAGTEIANDTAAALASIVEEIEKSANLVNSIAIASKEQASAIEQINQGILQVSQVVQSNASTSEESAAASQELSGQAAQLKEIVSIFKIRDAKTLETEEDFSSDYKYVPKSKRINLGDEPAAKTEAETDAEPEVESEPEAVDSFDEIDLDSDAELNSIEPDDKYEEFDDKQ